MWRRWETTKITVSVVNNFFDKIGATFTSAEEEFRAKRDALDSLIDYKLMVKGAYAANLDKDAEVDQLVNSEKSNFMFDELYRQEILPKLSVSDKEVDEFYERLKVEYHLTHILVSTQKEADSIAAETQERRRFWQHRARRITRSIVSRSRWRPGFRQLGHASGPRVSRCGIQVECGTDF